MKAVEIKPEWVDWLAKVYQRVMEDHAALTVIQRGLEDERARFLFDPYKHIDEIYKARSNIEKDVLDTVKRIIRFCESKGVRIGRDVEAAGPRGNGVGVSKIVGERVEVETRKVLGEAAENESVQGEASENQAEQY